MKSLFFDAISNWNSAYTASQLHFVGVNKNGKLALIAARIYMNNSNDPQVVPHYRAGMVEAGCWQILLSDMSVHQVVGKLLSNDGLIIQGIGCLNIAK